MEVTCPKCGKRVQVSDGLANTRVLCPYCRVTLTLTMPPQKAPMVQCDLCKIERPANQIQVIDSGEELCLSCVHELRGRTLETPPPDSEAHASPKQAVPAGSTSKQLKVQTKPRHLAQTQHSPKSGPSYDSSVKCPKCHTTQLFAAKKGYGGGKGCCGLLLLGPIGLLCGLCGANTMFVTCMKCGHKWVP